MPRSVRRVLAAACVTAMLSSGVFLVDAPWRLTALTAPAFAVLSVPRRDPAGGPAIAADPWRDGAGATLLLPPGVRLALPPPLPAHILPPQPPLRARTVLKAALLLALAVFVVAAATTSTTEVCAEGLFIHDNWGIAFEDCATRLAFTPQLTVAVCLVLAGAAVLIVRWSRSLPLLGRR